MARDVPPIVGELGRSQPETAKETRLMLPPFNAQPPSRKMGTSGTHFVPPLSPSLDPAAIENIEPKDRVRHEAAEALKLARSCADVALAEARRIHVDPTLDLPTRHRRAHDESFRLIAPAIAPLEAARAKNAKAIEELKKIIAGPMVELSDAAAIEIRTRLAGLPKDQRMAAIARSIGKGSDTIVAALLGAGVDRFLSENILSDIEIDAVHSLWAKTRHPGEVARLAILEMDERALAIGAAALQTFQRGCSDQAFIAADVAGIRPGGTSYGAPGPTPADRSRGMDVATRAAMFSR
jgi:hypothetical protein